MKVLMLGWEFPPKASGGMGTHCYYLTKAMKDKAEVTLVLRQEIKENPNFVKIISVGGNKMNPYKYGRYAETMKHEIELFTEKVLNVIENEDFEVIHAHDWLTAVPAMETKRKTGKPMILTIHSTEWDRSAGSPWPMAEYIEKKGCETADKIIAVSKKTKNTLVEKYGVEKEKIEVVYNAIDNEKFTPKGVARGNNVLFLGRLSMHKGPDYFLNAAKKVLEKRDDVNFLIAGKGEQYANLIRLSIDMGIEKNIKFLGYVEEEEKPSLYANSDMFVMTSVSEPFGITVLEAIRSGTPTIVPKNAGVSEVINHCFKVDFWDSHEIATKILALLEYKELREVMTNNAINETDSLTWDRVARETVGVYNSAIL